MSASASALISFKCNKTQQKKRKEKLELHRSLGYMNHEVAVEAGGLNR